MAGDRQVGEELGSGEAECGGRDIGVSHVESRKTFGDGGIRVLEKAGVVKPLAGERDISMFVDTAVAQLV